MDASPCGEEALAYYAMHVVSPEREGCGYIGSTIYFDHYGSLPCSLDSNDTADLGLMSHPKDCQDCGRGNARKCF